MNKLNINKLNINLVILTLLFNCNSNIKSYDLGNNTRSSITNNITNSLTNNISNIRNNIRNSIIDNINRNSSRIETINTNCSICLERTIERAAILSCKHAFCQDCIRPWINRESTCPLCRANIRPEEIIYATRERNTNNFINNATSLNNSTNTDNATNINTTNTNRPSNRSSFDHISTYISLRRRNRPTSMWTVLSAIAISSLLSSFRRSLNRYSSSI